MNEKVRILIAALNWGLGHATRCIPLIRMLQELDVDVHLASDGAAFDLLAEEFPNLAIHELPPYNIEYRHRNMTRSMAFQMPKILKAIQAERRAIRDLVRKHHIHGIISDNRYGCRVNNVSSVMICHQINVLIPNPALQWSVRLAHRTLLNAFDEVWIPDTESFPGLSGILSHPHQLKQAYYLGPLSRFQTAEKHSTEDAPKIKRKLLAVVSGPEPQRGYFEAELIKQLMALKLPALIVCGNTKEKKREKLAPHLDRISYLKAQELNTAFLESEIIICRSGYSSLMDLQKMGNQVILIPTPGQTEQEYLAKAWSKKTGIESQEQSTMNLAEAIKNLEKSKKPTIENNQENERKQKQHLKDWLKRLQ